MYVNSAYKNNSRMDFKDKTHALSVGSCGTYRLLTRPVLPTHRPRGRLDFQLLYIAAGKAHFFFQGEERIVPAGSVVIYRPKEEQKCAGKTDGEGLLYRVPIFDPLMELCSPPSAL